LFLFFQIGLFGSIPLVGDNCAKLLIVFSMVSKFLSPLVSQELVLNHLVYKRIYNHLL
jgi:hypothetical protein